jgi:hypothetical protein
LNSPVCPAGQYFKRGFRVMEEIKKENKSEVKKCPPCGAELDL